MGVGAISHLFIHDLVFKRLNPQTDGQGGFGDALTTVETKKGRVWPLSEEDMVVAGKAQAQVTLAVVFEPDEVIKVGEEFEWEGRRLVVRVAPIRPSVNIYTKVLVEEVQADG